MIGMLAEELSGLREDLKEMESRIKRMEHALLITGSSSKNKQVLSGDSEPEPNPCIRCNRRMSLSNAGWTCTHCDGQAKVNGSVRTPSLKETLEVLHKLERAAWENYLHCFCSEQTRHALWEAIGAARSLLGWPETEAPSRSNSVACGGIACPRCHNVIPEGMAVVVEGGVSRHPAGSPECRP